MKRICLLFLVIHTHFLSAQEPVLLKDIASNGAGSLNFNNGIEGISTSNLLFFTANDGFTNNELWRSNGTAAGTQLVKDINQGPGNSSIFFIDKIDDMVFFGADDGEHGQELWKTEGSESSTEMIKNINSGSLDAIEDIKSNYAVLNDELYFVADGIFGRELYKTDGTESNTILVKNIAESGFSSSPDQLTPAENTLIFVADDLEHGRELWRSDGSEDGTVMVKDINEGPGSSSIIKLKVVDNVVVFLADDGIHGLELWVSQGIANTTYMVKDLTEGEEDSDINYLEVVGTRLYFSLKDQETSLRYLWKTNGDQSTEQVFDDSDEPIFVGEHIVFKRELYFVGNRQLWKADGTTESLFFDKQNISKLAIMNDELYFTVFDDRGSDIEIWKTDGTTAGTVLVKAIENTEFSSVFHFLTDNERLYFTISKGGFGKKLWTSDGTSEGTVLLSELAPEGISHFTNENFFPLNDLLIFPRFDDAHGREVWVSDGTREGTQLLKDINKSTSNIYVAGRPVTMGNQVYFNTRQAIWTTDGSAENTTKVRDIPQSSQMHVLNQNLLFTSPTADGNHTLWLSDGTLEGTNWLFDSLTVDALDLKLESQNPIFKDELYFTGIDSEHGREIWKTDGTVEGTILLKDINPDHNGVGFPTFSSDAVNPSFAIFDDLLYFRASDNISGIELWKTDGTSAGTTQVSDINPTSSSSPQSFINMGNNLFFTANDGFIGRELWKSDGTTEGTSSVKDINPGVSGGLNSTEFFNFKNQLIFRASDNNDSEIWKSDGTEEGTFQLKNIMPFNILDETPHSFTDLDSIFIFIDYDSSGTEIWKSDGTPEGTTVFSEFEVYSGFVKDDRNVFFTAYDDEHGVELWKTDGTPEGTQMFYDIFPGPVNSRPDLLGIYNGALYFTAVDPNKGREMWSLTPLEINTQMSASTQEICDMSDSITFQVTVANAGENPIIRWFINDQPVDNPEDSILVASGFADGDEVSVQVIASKEVWVQQDSVFSESITIQYNPLDARISVAGNTLTATEAASYLWFFEGSELPEMTRSIEATESGNYQVEVTNQNGCTYVSSEIEVIVCPTTTPQILVDADRLTVDLEGTYQWFLNGVELTEISQSITAIENGEYQVIVTDAQGCKLESALVSVNITSLAKPFFANELKIYPNPAHDFLHIESPLTKKLKIRIINSFGKVVIEKDWIPGSEVHNISLAKLTNGVYLVKLLDSNGSYQRKLIKK